MAINTIAPHTAQQFNQVVRQMQKLISENPTLASSFKLEEDDRGSKQIGRKHDLPDGFQTYVDPYGQTGVFSNPFDASPLWSAVQQPKTLLDSLPMEEADNTNELQGIATGITEGSGDNPASTCDDPPVPGHLKICRQNVLFGQMYLGSPVIKLDQLGRKLYKGQQPRTIANYASGLSPLIPEPLRDEDVNYASMTSLMLYELGTEIRRAIARIEIDGDITQANTATERGWIREFSGLSRLIKNGYVDAVSGIACPAADSTVLTWDEATMDASSTTYGLTLPQLLNDLVFGKTDLADEVGMEETSFFFAMDKRLFRQLVFLMSCSYAMSRCVGTSGMPIQRAAAEIERNVNDMYRGRYLDLNGERWSVRFTSGSEVDTEGGLSSSIFFVPEQWNGNALTKLQYFPMDNAEVNQWIAEFGDSAGWFTSNNGMYAWSQLAEKFCRQMLVTAWMRMKVETPFLAARVDDIPFGSYVGYRDWDPQGASHVNGGSSIYSGNYFGDSL
jgi:hypothetical protein